MEKLCEAEAMRASGFGLTALAAMYTPESEH